MDKPTDATIEALATTLYFAERGDLDCWSDETDEVRSHFRNKAMRSLEPTPLPAEIERVCAKLAAKERPDTGPFPSLGSRQLRNPDGPEAEATIRALAAEVERLKALLVEVRDGHGCQPGYISTLTLQRISATLNRTEASHEG